MECSLPGGVAGALASTSERKGRRSCSNMPLRHKKLAVARRLDVHEGLLEALKDLGQPAKVLLR